MQPSLLGWSDMLADIGGFWVDRHSRRFAMGLSTVHRSGNRRSGAREQRSGVGIAAGSALFLWWRKENLKKQQAFHHPQTHRQCHAENQEVAFARESCSLVAAKPASVSEYPPLNFSLINISFAVRRSKMALSCLRRGPEKHNIWPGAIRNCRKVFSTRISDVDNKFLSPVIHTPPC